MTYMSIHIILAHLQETLRGNKELTILHKGGIHTFIYNYNFIVSSNLKIILEKKMFQKYICKKKIKLLIKITIKKKKIIM